jgi:hypothetical protein
MGPGGGRVTVSLPRDYIVAIAIVTIVGFTVSVNQYQLVKKVN